MNRYTTIDGLRGLAATAVMLHHFTGHRAFAPSASVLPSIANQALGVGNIGVPIFFVISGFVISNSIGLSRVDTYYILNFALRRSIRLDPPYWCTILLIVALDIVKSAVLSTPAGCHWRTVWKRIDLFRVPLAPPVCLWYFSRHETTYPLTTIFPGDKLNCRETNTGNASGTQCMSRHTESS